MIKGNQNQAPLNSLNVSMKIIYMFLLISTFIMHKLFSSVRTLQQQYVERSHHYNVVVNEVC